MFVINNEQTKKPIKIWLENEESLEDTCLEQAYKLSQLPFIHKWVALMPDTHAGMGMPIGGVIACKNVIIPNAVGVDIGCGMSFIGTDIKVDDIKGITTPNGSLFKGIIGDILRNVPVGFAHHKTAKPCDALDRAKEEMDKYKSQPELTGQIEDGYFQVGTLGGGNHFIEIQEDEEGCLGIMLHSGSRNFGKRICDYFNKAAKELNEKWYSKVPPEDRLAFLPADTKEGIDYINWMNLALDFAKENRDSMMVEIKNVLEKWISKYTKIKFKYTIEVNCHHNYASIENHYDSNVWVHRKGAIRAREGEIGIIPGAMGSYSYIVIGKGNQESFYSCSHGAGRRYSRKAAMENFTVEQVMLDLKQQNVVLGKTSKKDVPEESRFAYKDIEEVMKSQTELVTPIKRLKTLGVVKG
ncbi:MAG: RtcB family protein [Bacillota bacterium]|nr:RtcB family protein [Bacillota bacterium]